MLLGLLYKSLPFSPSSFSDPKCSLFLEVVGDGSAWTLAHMLRTTHGLSVRASSAQTLLFMSWAVLCLLADALSILFPSSVACKRSHPWRPVAHYFMEKGRNRKEHPVPATHTTLTPHFQKPWKGDLINFKNANRIVYSTWTLKSCSLSACKGIHAQNKKCKR